MRIVNNISAMNTNRSLAAADSKLSKSMERLSSGYRINRAADDAAGLAISEKMRAQINGLEQAATNAQDGISMIQTAEGGLNETHAILQRMRTLAVQAANTATLTVSDQQEIQKEVTQRIEEIDRIANDTEYNTKKLLNGSAAVQTTNANGVVGGTISFEGASITASTDDLMASFDFSTDNATESGVYQVVVSQTATAAEIGGALTGAGLTLTDATNEAGTLTINGESIEISATDSWNTVVSKINNVSAQSGVKATVDADAGITLTTSNLGNDATMNIQASTTSMLGTLGLAAAGEQVASAIGTDAVGTINGKAAVADGNTLTAGTDADGAAGLSVTISDDVVISDTAANTFTFDAVVNTDGKLTLQIGANEGQSIQFSINDMGVEALGLENLDLINDPDDAITRIDNAIQKVSSERANMGAIQNRLEHTIANLGVAAENLSSAESRIRDVDMASEVTEMTTQQILVQASTAMLAQANSKSQNVLSLLQ